MKLKINLLTILTGLGIITILACGGGEPYVPSIRSTGTTTGTTTGGTFAMSISPAYTVVDAGLIDMAKVPPVVVPVVVPVLRIDGTYGSPPPQARIVMIPNPVRIVSKLILSFISVPHRYCGVTANGVTQGGRKAKARRSSEP